MRNPLSLHHLTVLDVDVVTLAMLAGRLGCQHVCVFTHVPAQVSFPAVTDENEQAFLAAMAEAGITAHNTEFVSLDPGFDPEAARPGLARAARIGARRITAHCHDADLDRAAESLAALCDQARAFGLDVGVEWVATNAALPDLATANRLIDLAGRSNAGLVADVLHLARSGGRPGDLAALPPGRVAYAQISDGPATRSMADYRDIELIVERAPPGDGALPIAEFVAAIAAGVVIDVEAPQTAARMAGVPPLERARRAVEGARRFVR